MVYKRKTVTIDREEFNQLILCIQQVEETVDILKEKHSKNFKLNDWLMAIDIYTEILTNQLKKIIIENGYKEHLDLLKEWADNKII